MVKPVITCVVAVSLNTMEGCATVAMYGVTSYPVTGEPPSELGALHVNVACALPKVADPIVGGPAMIGDTVTESL